MDRKKGILLMIFLIFLVTPLSSAFNASSNIHSIGSYSMGSVDGTLDGTDLTGRDTVSYQQGASSATSTIYTLNLGGFNQVSIISEELTTTGETVAGGEGGGSPISVLECDSGYELINGECVEIGEVEEEIPSQLFDITFNLDDSLIQNINELSGIVTFESFGTVPTPVDLVFIILDNSGNEVYREESDVTVTTEEILRWNYEGLEGLPDGKYTAVLETLYNVDVFDEFRLEFEIGKERRGITGRAIDWIGGEGKWWLGGLIGLVAIGGLALWLIKKFRKKHREGSISFEGKVSKILRGAKVK